MGLDGECFRNAFPGLAQLGEHGTLSSLSLMQGLAAAEVDAEDAVPATTTVSHDFPNLALVAEITQHPILLLLVSEAIGQDVTAKAQEEQPEVLEYLAQLGYPSCAPALQQLQECHTDTHLRHSRQWEAEEQKEQVEAEAVVHMQGPAAQALRAREEAIRQKEQDISDRERALKEKELALAEQQNQLAVRLTPVKNGAAARSASPHRALAGVSGVLIDDDDLRELYGTYDRNGNGFVSRTEFKQEYRNFENFGLPLSDKELDRIFAAFGGSDDKLSYEEFCILMLKRAKI
eukprot:Hpha_TRINITY_DN10886_c0_g1::TRINITY_DN10886_c0_g1_i1::g.23242::m.23242